MVEEKHGRAGDEFPVNGEILKLGAVFEVRDALVAAGLTPPSEHQTILVETGRTHLLEAEDKVVVADHPQGALRVFPSGEDYGFTVDEISQVWGTEQIETDEFYSIWAPPAGHDWVLEREDEPDVVIRPNGTLSFGPKGVEHVVSRPHHGHDKVLVTVLTLSGIYPPGGAVRVDASERIVDVLDRAAKALHLTDTSGWILSVGSRDLDPSLTFAAAGLAGTVELDWMPREGGGGADA